MAGTLACLAAAAVEWAGLGRAPVLSVAESLLLLAPAMGLGYICIETLSKSREGGLPILLSAAGAALTASILAASAGPLCPWSAPPELAGPWLPAYAVTAFLGLGLLGAAAFQAVAFLVVERISPASGERAGRGAFWCVCLGLPPMIWSLLVAAAWGQRSGGDVWTWSGREVWALALVLVMAAYISLRHVGGWPERRSAWLLAGSVVVWAAALVSAPMN